MSEISFRLATQLDAEEIARLVNYVYRGESGARAWTGEAHLLDGQRTDADAIRDSLTNPQTRIILAFQKSELVGSVMIRAEGDRCYLGMLTVHVDLQKSGLGSALVVEAERVAVTDLRASTMFMHVISLRTELIDWYKRRGYSVTGEKAPFPYGDSRFGIPKRNDLEFVVLAKKLT